MTREQEKRIYSSGSSQYNTSDTGSELESGSHSSHDNNIHLIMNANNTSSITELGRLGAHVHIHIPKGKGKESGIRHTDTPKRYNSNLFPS